MKKKSVLLTLAFMSANAMAAPISQGKLASYQDAVQIALEQNPLNCTMTPSFMWANGTLGSTIKNTTSGDLNTDGSQPLLTFSYDDGSAKFSYSVITSADFKSVLSVTFQQKSCSEQDVNVGDLQNPQIVQQNVCSVTLTADCR